MLAHLLFLLLLISTGHSLPASDTSQDDAIKYLEDYGYLNNQVTNNNSPAAMVDLSEPLKKLQKFAGLKVTGKLDEETRAQMKKPRCQLPDIVTAGSKFAKRFSALSRWPRKALTYRIDGYPSRSYNLYNRGTVDSLILTAFKDWSDVANLKFTKSSSYYSDIKVDFKRGYHGDGNPFDGRGVTLAHAFFPTDGRLHFDDDESWSSGSYGGPNLRQVAAHEIGHILGLAHSKVRTAVMFPYYSYRSHFALQPDDVNGAVYLYGRKQGGVVTRNPSTRNPFFTRKLPSTRPIRTRPPPTRPIRTRPPPTRPIWTWPPPNRPIWTWPPPPRPITTRRPTTTRRTYRPTNNWWYWFFRFFNRG